MTEKHAVPIIDGSLEWMPMPCFEEFLSPQARRVYEVQTGTTVIEIRKDDRIDRFLEDVEKMKSMGTAIGEVLEEGSRIVRALRIGAQQHTSLLPKAWRHIALSQPLTRVVRYTGADIEPASVQAFAKLFDRIVELGIAKYAVSYAAQWCPIDILKPMSPGWPQIPELPKPEYTIKERRTLMFLGFFSDLSLLEMDQKFPGLVAREGATLPEVWDGGIAL